MLAGLVSYPTHTHTPTYLVAPTSLLPSSVGVLLVVIENLLRFLVGSQLLGLGLVFASHQVVTMSLSSLCV